MLRQVRITLLTFVVAVVTAASTAMGSHGTAVDPVASGVDADWLDQLVHRLDAASQPARLLADASIDSRADSVAALAGYFRAKPVPGRLWVMTMPAQRDPDFHDSRAVKALDHLITDREGEEQYGELLPWFSADKQIVTLSRFPHFDYLAPAYFHLQDERYAAAMVADMLDFVEHVPVSAARGYHVQMDLRTNPWNWVLLQWRVKRWIDALAYLRNSPSLSDANYLRIVLHILEEVEWVNPRKVLGLHNGTLGNLSAILYAADSFPEFTVSSSWITEAGSFYAAFLDTAFYPGEFLVELTLGYSEGTLLMCLDLYDALPESVLKEQVAAKLQRLVDAHIGMMKPDRSLPRYGDHGAYDMRDRIMRRAATLFDRSDYRLLADDPAAASQQLALASFPPVSDPYYLSGYYAMRDGWDSGANYLSIDAGPFGTNHHHGDKLSITVSADGADFIVDPGTSLYRSIAPGPRIDLRPGFLHNVLTVNGVDPNTGWDRHYGFDVLDNRWVTNSTYDFIEGVYEYRNNLVDALWRRSVLFRKQDYWVVVDALYGDEGVNVESNLQFDIDVDVEVVGEGAGLKTDETLARRGTSELRLTRVSSEVLESAVVVGDTTAQASTFLFQYPTFVDWVRGGRGWVGTFGNASSRDATTSWPAPALVRTGAVSLPFFDVQVMVPSIDGSGRAASVRWLEHPKETNGQRFSLSITHADGPEDVLVWETTSWRPSAPLEDDRALWYRVDTGRLHEIIVMNKREIEIVNTVGNRSEEFVLRFSAEFEGVVRLTPDGGWQVFGDEIMRSSPVQLESFVHTVDGVRTRYRPVDLAAGEWTQLSTDAN